MCFYVWRQICKWVGLGSVSGLHVCWQHVYQQLCTRAGMQRTSVWLCVSTRREAMHCAVCGTGQLGGVAGWCVWVVHESVCITMGDLCFQVTSLCVQVGSDRGLLCVFAHLCEAGTICCDFGGVQAVAGCSTGSHHSSQPGPGHSRPHLAPSHKLYPSQNSLSV